MKNEKMKWYFLIAAALIVGAMVGYFATNSLSTTGNAKAAIMEKKITENTVHATGQGYFFDCCCDGTDNDGCSICRCFNTGSPFDESTETYIDNK